MSKFKHILTATIYDKAGRILSIGKNQYLKSHPVQKAFAVKAKLPEKIYLHAEIAAIIKLKSGDPYKIKIERYSKQGKPLNAEPCPICKLAIKEANISVIEYTIS